MRLPIASTSAFFANWAAQHRRLFVAGVLAISITLWASAALGAWLIVGVVDDLPNTDELRNIGVMSRATTIYDINEQPAFTIFKEQRIEVPLSGVSRNLINALVAIEDQRFFEHGGVDVIRVGGAAWSNLTDGWGAQGGSTLTQQLARQSFLTREKTVRRKLKEIIVAARLEREFSKEQILELYLNKVYFGDGLYGAEAASLGYFGKHASDLDVAEAALLAGLVKAPSAYAPTVRMDRAIARRNATLQAMRSAGLIDQRTLDASLRQDVQLIDNLRGQESFGQYFKEEVRKQLVERFGWERVYEGGLRVYTTVDLNLQKAAEAEVGRAVTEIEERQLRRKRGVTSEPLQAALVAMDPRTGEVRAMVGGRSFDKSRFNRVTQAQRQAGSAFKTFVYAAALERGYTPASLIRPMTTPIMTLQGAWVPEDHGSAGAMTMRAALKQSSNRAAVGMLQEIGIPAALRMSEKLGIEEVPGVPSLALGSGEVTLMSMTAGYAAFANGGIRPEPIMIRRVETAEGEVLFHSAPTGERAVSEATAYLVTAMLSDVINGGTGWQARRVGFTAPAAGKTGTTNEYRDAWFVGYTPTLATGVWVGYDQPRTIIANGYAATLAVPLWGRFMAAAMRGADQPQFPRPRTVSTATICRISGKLATSNCEGAVDFDPATGQMVTRSAVYTEYFARGTEPVEYCPWHTHTSAAPYSVATSNTFPTPQPQADSTPPPSAPAATSGTMPDAPPAPAAVEATAAATPTAAAPAQRRGFWGRLFRRPAPGSAAPPPSPPATK
jgi:1A family penicillin-binding protein